MMEHDSNNWERRYKELSTAYEALQDETYRREKQTLGLPYGTTRFEITHDINRMSDDYRVTWSLDPLQVVHTLDARRKLDPEVYTETVKAIVDRYPKDLAARISAEILYQAAQIKS